MCTIDRGDTRQENTSVSTSKLQSLLMTTIIMIIIILVRIRQRRVIVSAIRLNSEPISWVARERDGASVYRSRGKDARAREWERERENLNAYEAPLDLNNYRGQSTGDCSWKLGSFDSDGSGRITRYSLGHKGHVRARASSLGAIKRLRDLGSSRMGVP